MTDTKRKPFYITTTLPYVNAEPHVGHAMEFVRADIIARFKLLQGHEVFFNTGTDEHGLKIYRKALEAKQDPQAYADVFAEKFKALNAMLGLWDGLHFIRTTDPYHVKAAQEFWRRCDANSFIYKKNYTVKYCVGCELEKTGSELVDNKCPLHPNLTLEDINEENYFFKFSAFQKPLLEFYAAHSDFVIPDFRYNEIKAFVERGLEDFSISRLKEKMPWGIAVPTDEKHVMYVWFDALVNYISAIGWPDDVKTFEKWHTENGGMVQYCGKDNLRQQSAMWQAMLMAAGLSNSGHIIINGFLTGEGGIKMSKSLGNTIDPVAMIKEYGTDAFRYFVAREVHPFEDSPFTVEKFKASYNANLANGLGNLVSRVMKMAVSNGIQFDEKTAKAFLDGEEAATLHKDEEENFEKYNIQEAANAIWKVVGATDALIQERQPFKKIKTDKKGAEEDIRELLARLHAIGVALAPIMPETSRKIVELIEQGKTPEAPLFLRKE